MEWATGPEYQAILDDAASELAWAKEAIEMDKLRDRMIAALHRMAISLTSKISK
jgi:hypothetical protein